MKKRNLYSILFAGVIVIILAMIVFYSVFSKKQTEEQARFAVQQNAERISDGVDAYIAAAINSIQLTSHLATNTMTTPRLEKSGEVLESLLEDSPFNFIEYIDQDGINTTDEGEKFDASQREYYIEGMKGNTGIWVNYEPKYSKEYLLNFYTPLYFRDEIVGVLTGTLGSETNIQPMLLASFFGERMEGILFDENGRVIASSFSTDKALYQEDILDAMVEEEEKDAIKRRLEANEEGVFEFRSKEGKTTACISVNERTGWKIFQIVPPKSFHSVVKKNTIATYYMIISICIILFMFVFHLHLDARNKHKRIQQEKERMEASYEQILTATASDTYKGIRRLDLETGKSDYIYFEDDSVKKMRIESGWDEWLVLQEKNVHPEDAKRVSDFFSLENLRGLQDDETSRLDYRSAKKNENGIYKAYSTTASIIYVDGKRYSIMTTIDNTAAIVHEREQKRLLAAAASIYVSMHVIDLKQDKLETLYSAEHITELVKDRTESVQELFREVMKVLTDKSYLDEMMDFIDFSTMDKRMEGTNNITLEFLGTKSGWCRARFIAVDYDEENRLNRVLWVVENIDKERKRTNRLVYLSETDIMTGVLNRGSGEKKIRELLDKGHEGMFCVLDVDHFKSINDEFGHAVGDKVIIAVANCLKAAFNENAVVLRLGGDEFAVFLENIITKEAGEKVIKRFYEELGKVRIPELQDHALAVSLGAAIKCAEDTIDFETLYHHADVCTYESKKTVGNKYVFYDEEQ